LSIKKSLETVKRKIQVIKKVKPSPTEATTKQSIAQTSASGKNSKEPLSMTGLTQAQLNRNKTPAQRVKSECHVRLIHESPQITLKPNCVEEFY
jgi:hypothetical protein